ncbi:phage tail tube protein [Gluconobacter morbifer]|uniref:Phage tail protein n=1 Tax=Gluconobacter morbifer G707 TaxID=1088869 RepID=G6XIS1_9PROT|nr:phage tail tube protein [Gluconobacter morbifer]EHH68379.1 hypothetical protein GMO_11490 [Gluconobacter morbifer G707]
MAGIYTSAPNSMAVRAGTVSVEIEGIAVDVASELTYDATTKKREVLTGQSGVQGYSETPKPGFISFMMRDSGGLSQAAIVDIGAVTVVAVLANGKTVVGTNVIATDVAGVNTAEGTFEVRFDGVVTEITK